VVVGAVALAVRLLYLLQLRDSIFFSLLIGDSLEYDAWAMRIAGGEWLGRGVFYQSPLYPYLLGLFYTAAGHHVFAVRIGQSILGAASCVFLAIAGRKFFSERTGLIAGGLLAIYPPAMFFDGLIQKSSLDLFLVTVLLVTLAACLEKAAMKWVVAAGLAFSTLSLNRENARLLYPVLAGWFLLYDRRDPLKLRVRRVVAFTGAAALLLVPVALRNKVVGGEFLISTSQFGPNFYIGNHVGATGGYEPLVPGRGNAAFERADATAVAESAAGRRLTSGEVSDYWWRRAVSDIARDPASWIQLLGWKARLAFASTEPVDTESLEAYAEQSSLLGALRWFSFGVLLPLALLGAWMTRSSWRRLWILHAAFVTLMLSVVIFYVLGRYRFPVVPIVALFAGGALADWNRWRDQRRNLVPALLVCTIVAAALQLPVATSTDPTYINYGLVLLQSGRSSDALPLLRKAVQVDPSHADARLSLAAALEQTQQTDAAMEQFRAAIGIDPLRAESHFGLAVGLHKQGRRQEAIAEYRETLRLQPASVEARSNLALALNEQGDGEDAVAEFNTALSLEPNNVPLRLNLGRVQSALGRTEDAIATFGAAAAVARQPQDILQSEYAIAEVLALQGRAAEAINHLERAQAAARTAGDTAALSSIDAALALLRSGR